MTYSYVNGVDKFDELYNRIIKLLSILMEPIISLIFLTKLDIANIPLEEVDVMNS